MTVSVIMTAHNTAPYVADAIRSVLASTHQDLQLCVVDDGSTDRTGDIIGRLAADDSRVRFAALPNQGRLEALRHAHDMATGDTLTWVDSDDLVGPTAIARCLAALDDDHQLVYTHRRLIDPKGRDRGPHRKNTIAYDPMKLMVSNMIFHLRVFTRQVFDTSGGVGELSSAIDWDMNLRMTEHTQPRVVPDVLYSYRVRPGRMSGATTQAANGQRAVRNAIARRNLPVELIVNDQGWHLRRTGSPTQGH